MKKADLITKCNCGTVISTVKAKVGGTTTVIASCPACVAKAKEVVPPNAIVKAHEADTVTLNDIQQQVTALAVSDARFNNKPASANNTYPSQPWCVDILRDEDEDTWSAIISALDGKLYKVSFDISEDDGTISLGADATETVRQTIYAALLPSGEGDQVKAGGFCLNGFPVVKAGAPLGNRNAAKEGGGGSIEGGKAQEMHSAQEKANSLTEKAYAVSKKIDKNAGEKEHSKAMRLHMDARDAHLDAAEKAHAAGYSDVGRTHESDMEQHKVSIRYHAREIYEKTKASDPSTGTDIVHCRATASSVTNLGESKPWCQGEEIEFMWMPGGVSTINAGFRTGSIELTVNCHEKSADKIQASFEKHKEERPKQEPFGCVEHREQEASVIPHSFKYKKDGDAGVYMAAEPTALGATNVNGKVHRSWSPSFTTDAEYNKCLCKACVKKINACECATPQLYFPKGVRGSKDNPAEITGLDFCVGTLTNKPAFTNMSPVKATDGKPVTAAPPATKKESSEDILNRVAAAQPPSHKILEKYAPKKRTSEEILASLPKQVAQT